MSYLSNYMPEHIFSQLIHGKVIEEKTKENSDIQFRDQSKLEIKRKPCGCMNNKIKEIPSS